jgi:hypothetical protein
LANVTETGGGSYDDSPEVPVSTVLHVPLLWRQRLRSASAQAHHTIATGPPRHRGVTGRGTSSDARPGRHRAHSEHPARVVTPARVAPPIQAQRRPDRGQQRTRQALAHTLRVGLLSAALVLVLFAGGLLAIAVWLP